jgi:hypothetical protein
MMRTVPRNWVWAQGLLVVAIIGLALSLGGCSTSVAGLPSGVEAAGGGLTITWKVPASGTIYLVEKKTGKIIETKSVNEGEVFESQIEPESAETFENAVGVPLANARIVLYFKPAQRKS